MRNWNFAVITDREVISAVLKGIPKKVSEKRVEFVTKSWKPNDCRKEMYYDAIPKQYSMLSESGCLIQTFFKQNGDLMKPRSLSADGVNLTETRDQAVFSHAAD